MAFVAVPYSITTGSNVDAGRLNTNFAAFTVGLSFGQKDINVDAVEASRLVATTLSVGDRKPQASLRGQRLIIACHKWNGVTLNFPNPNKYRPYNLGTTHDVLPLGSVPMIRSGSIVSARGYVHCSAYAARTTVSISPHLNGTVYSGIASLNFDLTATGDYEASATYSRGQYTFPAGSFIGFNWNVTAAGDVQTHGSLILEVVLDT